MLKQIIYACIAFIFLSQTFLLGLASFLAGRHGGGAGSEGDTVVYIKIFPHFHLICKSAPALDVSICIFSALLFICLAIRLLFYCHEVSVAE